MGIHVRTRVGGTVCISAEALIIALFDSLEPSQREAVLDKAIQVNSHVSPQIVTLVQGAIIQPPGNGPR